MSFILAPSVLSADFGNLQRDVEMINNSDADWFHIDIMDGMFVPNISFGFPVMEVIRKHAKKHLDVHLMIEAPDRYITRWRDAGANTLTVHYEACTHLHRTIQAIKQAGMHAGVALNPHTPTHLLADIITDLDLVCIMSVNPGFGGQKFIENTYAKIEQLDAMKKKTGSKALLEIDGGVDLNNTEKLVATGANVLVAGNTVFSAPEPSQMISRLKSLNPSMKLS